MLTENMFTTLVRPIFARPIHVGLWHYIVKQEAQLLLRQLALR